MILSKQELTKKEHQIYEENVVFDEKEYKDNPLLISIEKLVARVETDFVSDLSLIKIKLKGKLILRSTRTLKPVDYNLNIKDSLVFTFHQLDYEDENIIYLDDDELDLTPIFYSMLIASLPLKVIGKDEEDYFKGEDWEVITEDEYLKRHEPKVEDSPFAILNDLDLDD